MRTRKAIINSITALVYQIIALITGLILSRLILQTYGSEINGIMSSALQFMSIIVLLNIGITGAARVSLYRSLANNDFNQTNITMNAIVHYMNKVAMILAIYILILSFIFPIITDTSFSPLFVTMLVLSIGLNNFFEQFLGQSYRILLQADQNNYVENILSTICCILYTIISVILIYKGSSIISIKILSAFISLGTLLGIYIFVKKNYKLHRLKNYDTTVLHQRKDSAIHSIANIIHQNSDLIILTLFEDIKIVSVYTVYNFVIRQINSILTSLTSNIESALGNIWVKNEKETLQRTFKVYEWFTNTFIVIVFSCLMSLILPFVKIYTNGVTDIEYIRPIFAILIVISEFIFCLRNPYTSLIYAAGHYKQTKIISIIEAASNVILSLILVFLYGLNGVVIATIIANTFRTFSYMFYCSKNLLKRNYRVIMKNVIWTTCTTIIIIFTQLFLLEFLQINMDSIYTLFLGGITCLGISVALAFVSSYIFYKEEMNYFIGMLFGSFKKQKN